MIRALMERLSRGRIVKRRLPGRVGGGPIWLSPESALRYWTWNLDHPKHSKLLLDTALQFARPGGVAWDIGANCGVFSAACAGLLGASGWVLAIEPDCDTASTLRRNAGLAGLGERATIEVLDCAVSDTIGTALLNVAVRGRATNFLSSAGGRSDTGGVRGSRRVITVTLDWLATEFRMPTLMKIDVEGAEEAVLAGGQQVLKEARLVILCEVGEKTREAVCGQLLNSGYRLCDPQDPTNEDGWRACSNVLALPE